MKVSILKQFDNDFKIETIDFQLEYREHEKSDTITIDGEGAKKIQFFYSQSLERKVYNEPKLTIHGLIIDGCLMTDPNLKIETPNGLKRRFSMSISYYMY